MTQQTVVADGLFAWPSDEPALIASEADGRLDFPPRPGGSPYLLKRRGTLWSFTSQSFRPPSPPYDGNDDARTFEPYLVGYVELDGELLVEGRLVDCDARHARTGPADGIAHRALHRAPRRRRGADLRLRARRHPTEMQRVPPRSPSSASDCTRSAGTATSCACRWVPKPPGQALADAGAQWSDVQVATVGSYEVSNPDAIVSWLGLTGIPVRGIFNGCATGGTSLQVAAQSIRLGEADVAMAIGMDKHPRGAFAADPSAVGLPSWYGQTGMFLTTHFFGMKINRYMRVHGISAGDAGQGCSEEPLQRLDHPGSLAAQADGGGGDPRLGDRQLPADPLHVLQPRRGGSRCRAVPGRHRAPIQQHADLLAGRRTAQPHRRRVRAPVTLAADDARRRARRSLPSKAAFEAAGHRSRQTSTSRSCRTPTRVPRSSTWPRTASVPTASRRQWIAEGVDRARRPAAGQHRRWSDRERGADRRVGPAADPRDSSCSCAGGRATVRWPATRGWGTRISTVRRVPRQ